MANRPTPNPSFSVVSPKDANRSSLFRGVNAIINLAGAKNQSALDKKNKRSILNSRIQSTRLLFDAVKQTKQKPHLINASAIGIYPSDLQRQYTESDAVFSNDFDGEVVRQWEEEAKQFEKLSAKQPYCVLDWYFK